MTALVSDRRLNPSERDLSGGFFYGMLKDKAAFLRYNEGHVMKRDLYDRAKEYVAIIEWMENTTDAKELRRLEEKRIESHWKFIDALKACGIAFKDREHATRIALKLVREGP